jgi:hypothetical protein
MIPACHPAWLTVATILRNFRVATVMGIELCYWNDVPKTARRGRPREISSFIWEGNGEEWGVVHSL